MANVALPANSVIAARLAAGREKKKHGVSFVSAILLTSVLRQPTIAPNWVIGRLTP